MWALVSDYRGGVWSTAVVVTGLGWSDLTSFIMSASLDRARAVLTEDRVLRLTPAEVLQIEAALDAEAVPSPQLAALVRSVKGAQRASR